MTEINKIKENKMSLEVLMLESVGSCIDCTGTTYPLNVDGTPDLSSGVHFSECTHEWYDGLSQDDYSLFLEWHIDNNLSAFNKELI